MQAWIQSGGYRSNDPARKLADAINDTLAQVGGTPPPTWAVTRARLLARAPALAELLTAETTARVICETELIDPALMIRGTPDVVVVGERIAVIDLKTQTLKHDRLPPWAEFQLTIYAHLVERTHRELPTIVEVFSLNRGRLPVVVTPTTVRTALDAVVSARAADPTETRPAFEVCRFCARRLECQPHWDAAVSWATVDCVEGIVERTEQSSTGVIAVLVETAVGPAWVTGMPSAAIALGKGERFRAVRLLPADAGTGERRAWRWAGASAAL
jgi:hypothetical protein